MQATQGRTVERGRGEYIVRGDDTENRAVIARFGYARGVEASREQAEEWARELASAPDLRAALERLISWSPDCWVIGGCDDGGICPTCAARAELAKAGVR